MHRALCDLDQGLVGDRKDGVVAAGCGIDGLESSKLASIRVAQGRHAAHGEPGRGQHGGRVGDFDLLFRDLENAAQRLAVRAPVSGGQDQHRPLPTGVDQKAERFDDRAQLATDRGGGLGGGGGRHLKALDPDPQIERIQRGLHAGEQVARLTPKQAMLLQVFMEHAGQTMTRKDLMATVWNTDYMGDTRTLDVHVRWLREKIEDEPSHPRYLRTVRGIGYRLGAPPAE